MLTKKQFKEFQIAINHGLDPKEFPDTLNDMQMHEKRLALENGMDVSLFTPDVSADKMRLIRQLMEMDAPVNPSLVHNYDEDQLREIKLGVKYNLNTELYSFPFLSASQMRSMRLRMMATNLLHHIKITATEFLRRLEDKIIGGSSAAVTNQERQIAALVTLLKQVDLSDKNTIDDVLEAVKSVFDSVNEIDPEQDILSEEPKQSISAKVNGVEADILNVYRFSKDRSFALLKLGEDNFLIVNNFKIDDQTGDVSFKESESYKDVMEAAAEYQDLISEAQKKEKDVNSLNLNMYEWELLENDDPLPASERVTMIQEHKQDIHPAVLMLLISNENEDKSIRQAAQAALNQLKSQEKQDPQEKENKESPKKDDSIDKYMAAANSLESGSSKLHSIASKTTDEKVLLAVLANPNCSNATMYMLQESENETISKAADQALHKREETNKFESVTMDKSAVCHVFQSENKKDKSGKPLSITIIALPQENSIGMGATIAVPSNSVKTVDDQHISVSINTSRNLEVRLDKARKIISGKEVVNELQKGKTLDERLKHAKDKTMQTSQKEEVQKEKAAETVVR